jgi:DNA-binding NtrC family response regulator
VRIEHDRIDRWGSVMRDPHVTRQSSSSPRTALVVDDDPHWRQIITRRLHRGGWRSEHAASVVEARVALTAAFDAVLIDLNLGGGGRGEQVLELLACRALPVATVVLSAYAGLINANTLGLEGVPFLDKCVEPTILLATLDDEHELTRRVIARGLTGVVARTEKGLLRTMLAKLRASRANQRQAAVALGIPRTTLRDKMDAYGLESAMFKRPTARGG